MDMSSKNITKEKIQSFQNWKKKFLMVIWYHVILGGLRLYHSNEKSWNPVIRQDNCVEQAKSFVLTHNHCAIWLDLVSKCVLHVDVIGNKQS